MAPALQCSLQNLKPDIVRGRLVCSMLVCLEAALAVALLATSLLAKRSVIDSVLAIAGFTTGMILGLFLLGRLPRPVRSGPALTGLVVGFLMVLSVWLFTPLAWPWYPLIGTIVTVATALLVDRMGDKGEQQQ